MRVSSGVSAAVVVGQAVARVTPPAHGCQVEGKQPTEGEDEDEGTVHAAPPVLVITGNSVVTGYEPYALGGNLSSRLEWLAMSTLEDHEHPADLDAFLDLVNTLELEDGRPVEHLPDIGSAIAFLDSRGLGHRAALEDAAGDERGAARRLMRLRAVRGAAREVWDALVEERGALPAEVERLNDALRHRPIVELTAGGHGLGVGHRHVGDPWDEALARTLEPFVAAVGASETNRFRVCANDGCRWIFYDESRAGRRRWCDMSSCGNRAKAARHRARKKGIDPEDVGVNG